ncbi:MAG: hypothetical protein COA78_31100, partial [Blastopirellula sp.]
ALANDANTDADDVQFNSVSWTVQGDGETLIEGIDFTGIETINIKNSAGIIDRVLKGTTGNDFFGVEGTNAVSAKGITYYGIGTVLALSNNDNTDADDIHHDSAKWDVQDTDNSITIEGIDFTGIETINKNNSATVNDRVLTGTTGNDFFGVEGTNAVSAKGITYYGIGTVNALANNDNTDADDVQHNSANWTVQGDGETLIEGIDFTGIETINIKNSADTTDRVLTGTTGNDFFGVEGSNAVSAKGITYYGIGTVLALANNDNTDADDIQHDSAKWDVQDTDNAITIEGINFTGIETININNSATVTNRVLTGTTGNDFFGVEGTNAVSAKGITYYGIGTVNALANVTNTDADDVQFNSTSWTVQGDSETLIEGINFTGIETININNSENTTDRVLTGTTGNDFFGVEGINAVSAKGITYYGIGTVDALANVTNTDADDVQFNSASWTVQGENETSINGINFSNIESININNSENVNNRTLNGTSGKDVFKIEGDNTISAMGVVYYGIGTVDALNSEEDVVSGSNLWSLSAIGFDSTGISFLNTEVANSTADGELMGTKNKDVFIIKGINSVEVAGTTFNGVIKVDAQVNTLATDLDSVSGSNTWDLLSIGFKASEISFINTEVANSGRAGTLNEIANIDEFKLIGLQSVAANGTTFNQVTLVNAQGIANTLVGMEGTDEFYLSSVNSAAGSNKVTSQEIDFNNITVIDGGAGENRVHGSAGSDSFQLTDVNQQLVTNNMTFNNIQTVEAAEGQDNLMGQVNQRWQVSNADNTIVAQGINFIEIETVSNSGLGVLVGSGQADQFALVSTNGIATDNAVMVNQLVFSNIGSIDAGDNGQGEDVVTSDIAQTWQLADDSNFIANGILLSNIERATAESSTVMGSIAEDIFATTDITNTVLANDVLFDNVILLDGNVPGLSLTHSADLDAQQNNFNNADQVAAADKFIINSNNNITITQGDGFDSFSQSGDQSSFSFDFKNIEIVDIVTTGDVNSTSGFEYLTVDATNLTINTAEDITINDFNVTNDLVINSQNDITFLNDAEFTGKSVTLSGDDISFRGSLKIASDAFAIDASKLNVEGDIDADVNAERTVATDVGQDIKLSIFNSIDIFLASESSILRKDEIDNADRLKRLLEETELEL